MGFLELLGIKPTLATEVAARQPAIAKTQLGILSPFTDSGALAPIIAGDLWPGITLPLTRVEAMKVPAIAKARAVLHAIIGTRPLVALQGDTLLAAQPSWLYRSDTGVAANTRSKLILDDLIFNEAALLALRRGADGTVLDAVHVPYSRWKIADNSGDILVDNEPVPTGSVKWIPGPWAGLLVHGEDTIRAARDTTKAWTARVRNPFPAMELHETEDTGMTQDEVKAYVKAVAAARRDPDNAVIFTPYNIDLNDHKAGATDLYESGRNALRLDIANLFNMPAALLDGSVSEASLTYSTQEGRRNELFDYTIGYWAGPIQDALSLDDMVPRGTRVAFDFEDLLNTAADPTGPAEQD